MEPFGAPSPAAVELAARLRAVHRRVLDPGLSDAERAALAEQLALIVGDAPVPTSRYTTEEVATFRTAANAGVNPRGTHPFYGAANPSGVAMRFEGDGERVAVHARFDIRHEGAPGWVHGGIVASGFDIVLGQAAVAFGGRGPTGTMSIRFRAPTPIDVDVVYSATLERQEDRKTFVEAELRRTDTGELCATSRAVFIRHRAS